MSVRYGDHMEFVAEAAMELVAAAVESDHAIQASPEFERLRLTLEEGARDGYSRWKIKPGKEGQTK